MTRLRRVVAINVPHHLTQRGNARQYILNRDEDRAVYLMLLRGNIENYEISLLGDCLMSNHVHLIAVPTVTDLPTDLPMSPICLPICRHRSAQPRAAGRSAL